MHLLLTGTLTTKEDLLEFADDFPCYYQFDLFGIENSYYQLAGEIDFPSDAQRMNLLKALKDEGLVDRILVAHDIHTKHRLVNGCLRIVKAV